MKSFPTAGRGRGAKRKAGSLLVGNSSRGFTADNRHAIPIDRNAVRTSDQRDEGRHGIGGETADIVFRGEQLTVDLINLSGGGAMIAGEFAPRLWEELSLVLGEHGSVQCTVCWIRNDRVGLEFADATDVIGDAETRSTMLIEVLRRAFPHLAADALTARQRAPAEVASEGSPARREEERHALVWSGVVRHEKRCTTVRLRNISAHGAMIDSPHPYPTDVEVDLDLGDAGMVRAIVCWSRGDQVGLRFRESFDIAGLANFDPELAAPNPERRDAARIDQADGSPWAKPLAPGSIEHLKATVEGYLKR